MRKSQVEGNRRGRDVNDKSPANHGCAGSTGRAPGKERRQAGGRSERRGEGVCVGPEAGGRGGVSQEKALSEERERGVPHFRVGLALLHRPQSGLSAPTACTPMNPRSSQISALPLLSLLASAPQKSGGKMKLYKEGEKSITQMDSWITGSGMLRR
ncbi:hypothetical protein WMY93_030406 [Mugilogobius chulae]|uniref:Uncharacterized protein n=1 Tax=Mugilogobius chulae TaxID=88201 RepID=A0AAW0MFD8_9GOBI